MSEPVDLFTITSFFKDDPLRVKKGFNAFNSDRVVNVTVLPGGVIKGKIQASMRNKPNKLVVIISQLSDLFIYL